MYYAKVIDDWDSFEPREYYGEDYAVQDHISVYKGAFSLNSDMYDNLQDEISKALYEMKCDLSQMFEEGDDDLETNFIIIQGDAECYIKLLKEVSSENKQFVIRQLLNLVDNRDDDKVDALILKILEFAYGEEFSICVLRGSAQRDWAECVYPTSDKELVDYITALYFRTGTMLQIGDEEDLTPDSED